MTEEKQPTPNDAAIVSLMLKENGITEFEPAVVTQLLELTYRYVTDILEDAQLYSQYASKKVIDCDDVKLSIQSKLDQSFTTPPPRELLMDLAKSKNSIPLPPIKPFVGIKLPPDRFCLSAPNFKIKYQKKARVQPYTVPSGVPTASTSSTSQ